jgi:hypothetical protein
LFDSLQGQRILFRRPHGNEEVGKAETVYGNCFATQQRFQRFVNFFSITATTKETRNLISH